jgi:ABC-type lipoprotein release transport system permease subunit
VGLSVSNSRRDQEKPTNTSLPSPYTTNSNLTMSNQCHHKTELVTSSLLIITIVLQKWRNNIIINNNSPNIDATSTTNSLKRLLRIKRLAKQVMGQILMIDIISSPSITTISSLVMTGKTKGTNKRVMSILRGINRLNIMFLYCTQKECLE